MKLYTLKQCDDKDVLADYTTCKEVKLFGQSENVRVIIGQGGNFVFEVDKGDEIFFFGISADTLGGMVEAIDNLEEAAKAHNKITQDNNGE